MVLNFIWLAFFVIGFCLALVKLVFFQDYVVFPALLAALFDSSRKGFEISLGLAGTMTLWLGLMRVGEEGGLIGKLARFCSPFFSKLFPEIPSGHPVMGSIMMNFSANMLGLDNAASPLGLKAMQQMQDLNGVKDRASNAMIMFLVINTAGLTIIPVSVMALRLQAGAFNPADIFLPCLLGTTFSALVGIVTVAIYQRINLFDRVLLLGLGSLLMFVGGVSYLLLHLSETQVNMLSSTVSAVFLMGIIIAFLLTAAVARINVYEAFIEGAKEGFAVSVKVIPYIVGMLVGIGIFRESGALTIITDGIASVFDGLGLSTAFVPALPTGLMKPFSGSGARGLMVEAMKVYGPDSFVGKLVCILQGSTETTFYTIALYYGSVGIKRSRYTAQAGLFVDIVGIIFAIMLGYLFFKV